MSTPDPATIDAVAAFLSKYKRGSDVIWDEFRDEARALASAGWLRTAEDRAVLDAAEAYADVMRYPNHELTVRLLTAVRARRVAAGGTEAQP